MSIWNSPPPPPPRWISEKAFFQCKPKNWKTGSNNPQLAFFQRRCWLYLIRHGNMKSFPSCYGDPRWINRDLCNRATSPSHVNPYWSGPFFKSGEASKSTAVIFVGALITTVFFSLTARWDRSFPICLWIFVLGCLPHEDDDRWCMGWSPNSKRCGELLRNMYSSGRQSSRWCNDLPRVWCYW